MTAGTARTRRKTWRGFALALAAIVAVAGLTAWLTAPRGGGLMNPDSTSTDGAHALVTLLRERGVDVVVADSAADARRAASDAGSDTLLLVAQTPHLSTDAQLADLVQAPGDRLLVDPGPSARNQLASGIRTAPSGLQHADPDCDLRAAQQAGAVNFGDAQAFTSIADDLELTRCYGGVLVRYQNGPDSVTVVGASGFMTNGGLLREGNAALAMNLAGSHAHLIWYAPQRAEGEKDGAATLSDLIPARVYWILAQLALVVVVLGLWRSRRMGPLVAETLPVVVRASETVEGRGRLYRSRRARVQAAGALRTAALQRLTPRLGLGPQATPEAVAMAVAAQGGGEPRAVHEALFGPPPHSDDQLVQLANTLDTIERQVRRT